MSPTIAPRLIAASLAWTLVTLSPAIAEVCDKAVGDDWRPGDGPVWILNPVGWPIGSAVVIGGLFLAGRLRWVGYLGASVLMLAAIALLFADLIPQHDIYLAEIREGCRSLRTDLMDLGFLIVAAAAYGFLGYRAGRKSRLHGSLSVFD